MCKTDKKREGLPPKGWHPILNATTAPKGWQWWRNGNNRFGGEYENALFLEKIKNKSYEN